MKKEYAWAYIQILAMIIFLITTFRMFKRVDTTVNNVEETAIPVTIVTTRGSSNMDISIDDLLSNENKEIGSSSASILLTFNYINATYEFDIIMHNNTSYTKTKGVDGINTKEFTYEIKANDVSLVPETEIKSYKANSDIVLTHQYLSSSEKEVEYEITFRFYSNPYDQSALKDLSLNSYLTIKTA